jgi:hypothetical protein
LETPNSHSAQSLTADWHPVAGSVVVSAGCSGWFGLRSVSPLLDSVARHLRHRRVYRVDGQVHRTAEMSTSYEGEVMPGGRPSIYSQELADRICERLASGESLRAICLDDGMPSWPTISKWLNEKPEFVTQYARAREDQAEAHADRIIEIADDADIDPHHKRIMVDARKWVASKLKPKRYGDKLDLEHKGEVGLTVNVLRFTDADKPTG